jgi:hypothetical protein
LRNRKRIFKDVEGKDKKDWRTFCGVACPATCRGHPTERGIESGACVLGSDHRLEVAGRSNPGPATGTVSLSPEP